MPFLTTPIPPSTITTIRPLNYTPYADRTEMPGIDAVFRATTTTPALKREPTATIAAWIYALSYPPTTESTGPNVLLETGNRRDRRLHPGHGLHAPVLARFGRDSRPWSLVLGRRRGIGIPPDYLALGQAGLTFEEDPAAYLLHMATRRPT